MQGLIRIINLESADLSVIANAIQEQPYSKGCLVGAALLLLVAVANIVPIFAPSYRNKWFWGDGDDKDSPLSGYGHFSWALCYLAFSLALVGEGLHIEAITRNSWGFFSEPSAILLLPLS